MAGQNLALVAFNRGLISPLALARVADMDQAVAQRVAISAETYNNFMPRVLGSTSLRPGWEYIGATASNAAARLFPFIFSTDDTALIEFTATKMRVWESDALVSRPTVSTTITNGDFGAANSWTDNDEGSATSTISGNILTLTGNGTDRAIREQQVTVAGADQNVVHALNIHVQRGPAMFRVGSTSGDDDYVAETTLRTGYHNIAFTPTGDFFVRLFSSLNRDIQVNTCDMSASGAMTLTSPYAAADLDKIKRAQSGDVIFLACEGVIPHRIERRSNSSWSIVEYQPEDGPYGGINASAVTLTPAALSTNTTLTASKALFKSTDVGRLFRLESDGQTVSETIDAGAADDSTASIKVTGVTTQRVFGITLTGTWVGTIKLQSSVDDSTWTDVAGQSWTANVNTSYDDGLDNQIVYYRLFAANADWTSGSATGTLQYDQGSIIGDCRVTAFTNSTTVDVEVYTAFGSTSAQQNWYAGDWSDRSGFPSAVQFHEGRLWWFGKNGIWGSVSDAFDVFEQETIGDSGPINRTIGSGPVDKINWALSLQRLVIGAEGAEFSIKSTSLDEPLTPTNFNIRESGTEGSADIEAVKIDSQGIYVQRGGFRVFGVVIAADSFDYEPEDLSSLVPNIGDPGIVRMAVQNQPDRRVHCVKSDGTVSVLIFDRRENVLCWVNVSTGNATTGTNDAVEDVAVLPSAAGNADDDVYYVVQRTVNGATVRHIEKWAQEADCVGGDVSKQADSFKTFTSLASSTITGADHLEGATDVVVWADGKCLTDANGDIAKFTVSSGNILLTDDGSAYTATNGMYGLQYTSTFKSGKLLHLTLPSGTSACSKKRIDKFGVILADAHHKGLEYGRSTTDLRDLPQRKDGNIISADTVHSDYESELVTFPGEWNTDSRLHLKCSAPRPCTILAAVIGLEAESD